ncbi:lysophospholipid acyltransferase family protein [Pseudomonas sp. RIT-PI-AD]|uniref:lysophospholipid acyltransferase family protein n=1 Tax=Pseudomonas sp. RIT-PI-AD TaxID=3035294 RepID=UPI0023EF3297|nr:lysophospholipid acyltransferase family protein [Pseudomonas sp. RIT-PI-AD]
MRRPARLARLCAVLLLGIGLAAVAGLLERLTRDPRLRPRLTRWFLARLARALPMRVRVHGQVPREPMLWVANHVSWTDIPLLGALAPLAFLSKAEVRAWPLAGWLAQQAGTLFIRRGAGEGALLGPRLAQHLRQDRALLIFPEGTTTDGNGLRTFHGRLLACALEAQRALQPVAIRYRRGDGADPLAPFVGDDDLVSHLLRLFEADVGEVDIHLLAPIPSQGLSRNELAARAQAAIAEALGLSAPALRKAA